jgi:hypothetical protein
METQLETTFGVVDVPILGKGDDHLGLQRYAEALGRFVLQCDTPMTVGIQGDWGAGKTSLMNLIVDYLGQQPESSPITVTLNTWQYAQVCDGNELALVVLQALQTKIAGTEKALTKVWQKVARTFSKIKGISFLGIGVEAGEAAAAEIPDLGELKEVFRSLVRERLEKTDGADRVVVLIDDLDRVLPERAVEILEALKNFVDVERCVFVLACDYAVVTKGLKQKFKVSEKELGGRSFFDKIIQVPFQMPVYQYEVQRYLRAMLGRIDWKLWDDDISLYEKLLKHSVGFNPRGLKRLCNTLLLLRMVAEGAEETRILVADEHRLAVLFSLVCMESAHERLYKRLAEAQPDELESLITALAEDEIGDEEGDARHSEGQKDVAEGEDDGEEDLQLSSDERSYLDVFRTVLDRNKDGTLDPAEIVRLQEMLKLSAITALTEEPRRSSQRLDMQDWLANGADPVVRDLINLLDKGLAATGRRWRPAKASVMLHLLTAGGDVRVLQFTKKGMYLSKRRVLESIGSKNADWYRDALNKLGVEDFAVPKPAVRLPAIRGLVEQDAAPLLGFLEELATRVAAARA